VTSNNAFAQIDIKGMNVTGAGQVVVVTASSTTTGVSLDGVTFRAGE
jgi:hypothetical protein